MAAPLSFLGTAASIGADVTPFGSPEKAAGKEGLEQLAKAGTEKEVRKIMEGTPQAVVDKTAHAIAQTKDPHIVDNIIQKAYNPAPEIAAPLKPIDTGVAPPTIPQDVHTPDVSAPVQAPQSDPFDEILGAVRGTPAAPGQAPVRGLASARAEQDALISQQRGQRFAAADQASKDLNGSDAYFARKRAQKGDYGKVDYHPLVDTIGADKAENLFTQAQQKIYNTPDDIYHEIGLHPGGARLSTETAVRKVLGLEPGLPTKSELKLLNVFSPDLADEVKKATPVGRKIFDAAGVLFGNARSIKSSVDFSMGGRQGLFVAARHPVLWADANKESVKYAESDAYYKNQMRDIHGDDWGKFIDSHNPSVLTGGATHEEAYASDDIFASKAAKKVGVGHLVAGSERAYTGGLTKLRKDMLVKAFQSYGSNPEEVMQTLGQKGVDGLIESVSTLTGRGGKKGGWVSRNAHTLQEALFSPRLWASRLQPLNPSFWNRIGPAGRKEAMQSLGSFAAVAAVVLEAAHAAGADVESDPRSSDFLKIKVGDTRYDILGGFQQNLVFGARQISNSTKSSTTGAVSKFGEGFGAPTRLSSAFDLVRNKSNPIVSAGANILEGKDKAGNKINPATEIGQLFVPISLQGTYQTAKSVGSVPKGILKNSPDYIGIGSQTYGVKDVNITDHQKKELSKVKDPGTKDAYTSFLQTQKIASGTKKNASEQVKAALAANDIPKAVKIAKAYNATYSKGFDVWRKQNDKYRSDETLNSTYSKGIITDETLTRYIDDIKKGN